MSLIGFWSYVHKDDDFAHKRVTQLGKDIVDHYASITAEEIELFRDRDDLNWGDKWRGRVDEALTNVAFFIPVITPRYFKSSECRREFQLFVSKAKSLGLTELVMPILYIPVPELLEENPSDDLIRIVQEIQWDDWTQLRFKDRTSGEYQEAVHGLAQELHRRITAMEKVDVAAALETAITSGESDDAGGSLDRLAALEAAMPKWVETLATIAAEIERIGDIMSSGTQQMEDGEKAGKGFAARLTVARKVAAELAEPVDRIVEAGSDFATGLSDIDAGVRTIVEEAVEENVNIADPEYVELDAFFVSIRGLSLAAQSGLGSISGLLEAAGPIERMSKDMRAPLRKLRTALTSMLQAQQTTDAWIGLLDANSFGLSLEGQALADKWSEEEGADS